MEFTEAVLLTIITASTPLLLAASGELVVERSGVINLGVEGMMIVGAACGFVGAHISGSVAVNPEHSNPTAGRVAQGSSARHSARSAPL